MFDPFRLISEDYRSIMRKGSIAIAGTAVLLLTIAVAARGRREGSSDQKQTIAVGGLTRTYLLHVPESLGSQPVP